MLWKTLALAAAAATFAVQAETPAAPAASPGSAPATQSAPAPKDSDLICTNEASMGTRLKKRVCTTRADRDSRTQQDQGALQQMQSQNQANPTMH